VPIEASANPAVTRPTTAKRRYTATVNSAISATPDGGRRRDTEQHGGDREADRPASAQPHTQAGQPAKGDVDGERHGPEMPVEAVDEGEHREPHGQQETQGVGHPVPRRAPDPAQLVGVKTLAVGVGQVLS